MDGEDIQVGEEMKKCPRCKKDINDTDSKCPHCGYRLGYHNDNNQPDQNQRTPRRTTFVQRMIFYSLIAGFVFGPSYFNMYNRSSSYNNVADQDVASNEMPLYIYTSLETYQADFPQSAIVSRLTGFEDEFQSYLSSLSGEITGVNHQVTITNTSAAYVLASYDLDIDGTSFKVELNYNSASEDSSLLVSTSSYNLSNLDYLRLSEGNNEAFQKLTGYLGLQSEPLYAEATGEFNAILDEGIEGDMVGRYGLGVTVHNNGSSLNVYYASDLVSPGETPGYVLDLKFTGAISEGILGTLR